MNGTFVPSLTGGQIGGSESDFVIVEWSDSGESEWEWIAPLHVHHEDDDAREPRRCPIVGVDNSTLLAPRFARHHAVIGHVQVAAVPSRAEPDEGEVNYAAIFDMLDRSDYAGFVGCEYRPRRNTEDGLGWARRYGVGPSP